MLYFSYLIWDFIRFSKGKLGFKNIIELSEKNNKLADLLSYFENKMIEDKTNSLLLTGIAEIYQKLNNLKKAKEIYEEVLKIDTNNQIVQEKLEKINQVLK